MHEKISEVAYRSQYTPPSDGYRPYQEIPSSSESSDEANPLISRNSLADRVALNILGIHVNEGCQDLSLQTERLERLQGIFEDCYHILDTYPDNPDIGTDVQGIVDHLADLEIGIENNAKQACESFESIVNREACKLSQIKQRLIK